MKKLVLLVALAAIAMSSCSKTESLDDPTKKQIGFNASIGKNSKAGPISGTVFPTDDPDYLFSILAYYKPVAGSYDYGVRYIDDQKVSFSGSEWKTETPYYWPTTGTLKFVAYAPFVAIDAPDYNATDGIIFPDFSSTPGTDLMYTDATADLSSGSVPLSFKHALTQVYFTMATTQLGVAFHIDEFTIDHCVDKGSFKSLPTPTWTLSTNPSHTNTLYDILLGETGDVTIKSTDAAPFQFTTKLLLIPQPVTTIQLTIKYHLTLAGLIDGTTKTKTFTLSGAAWAPNQRVKYAISITDTGIVEITYTPSVSDWATETTGTTAP